MLKKNSAVVVCGLTALALSSCAKGGGGGLGSLTEEQKAAFDSWKSSVVKACEASASIGQKSRRLGPGFREEEVEPEYGLDVDLMKARFGGEGILTTSGGEFFALGDWESFSGLLKTNTGSSSSVSINGSSSESSVKIEAERNGSSCKVMIDGQLVYEGKNARHFDIVMHGRKLGNRPGDVGSSQVRTVGPLGRADGSALTGALHSAIRPDEESIDSLAKELGLSKDLGKKLLQARASGETESMKMPGTAWFNRQLPELLGESSQLMSPGTRKVDWRLAGPKGTRNLEAELTLRLVDASKYEATVQNVRYVGTSPHDFGTFTQCMVERATMIYRLENGAPANAMKPSMNEVLYGCSALSADAHKDAYALDGAYSKILPVLFEGPRRATSYDYRGWDSVLFNQLVSSLRAGKNPSQVLDPQGRSQLISSVTGIVTAIYRTVEPNANFGRTKDALYKMGFDWILRAHSVPGALTDRILRAVENTAVALPDSTQRLIGDLGVNPTAHDLAIDFALGVDATYKAEVARVLAIAESLQNSEWINRVYGRLLQNRTPLAAIRLDGERMSTLSSALSKHGATLSRIRGKLVGASMSLMEKGLLRADELDSVFGSIANSLDTFEASTMALVREMESGALPRNQLQAAAQVTPEMKALIQQIQAQAPGLEADSGDLGALDFSKALQDGLTLDRVRALSGAVQAGVAYTQREKQRMAGEWSTYTNESNRKKLLRMALEEAWQASDFDTMEKIAELGKLKSTFCANYKGMSSVVDCLSLSNFGKRPGKFMAAEYGPRYGALAAQIQGYLNRMKPEFDFHGPRGKLLDAFFNTSGAMFHKCSAAAYPAKVQALDQAANAVINNRDFMKKYDLERALEATLANCP